MRPIDRVYRVELEAASPDEMLRQPLSAGGQAPRFRQTLLVEPQSDDRVPIDTRRRALHGLLAENGADRGRSRADRFYTNSVSEALTVLAPWSAPRQWMRIGLW